MSQKPVESNNKSHEEQMSEMLNRLDGRLKRIEKKFAWQTALGFIKFVFIVGPIIAGIIYLSPFVKTYISSITPILEAFNLKPVSEETINTSTNANDGANQAVMPVGIQEAFCDPQTREVLVKQYCK